MSKSTKVRSIMTAAAAVGALAAPSVAHATQAQIIGFTHAGSGCPGGSVGYVFDSVNDLLTLSFDSYATYLPPGTSKSCNLSFIVKVPFNAQISLNRVEILGYHEIDPNVKGEIFRYYKYGTNHPTSTKTTFNGPKSGIYDIIDQFVGVSACTNTVTVLANTRINLTGTPAPGNINELVVDAIQYNTKVVYSFLFTPC